MFNMVLVWMLMTIQYNGGVKYSPATDLESCMRMQEAARHAHQQGFHVYSKCIQIRVDPTRVQMP